MHAWLGLGWATRGEMVCDPTDCKHLKARQGGPAPHLGDHHTAGELGVCRDLLAQLLVNRRQALAVAAPGSIELRGGGGGPGGRGEARRAQAGSGRRAAAVHASAWPHKAAARCRRAPRRLTSTRACFLPFTTLSKVSGAARGRGLWLREAQIVCHPSHQAHQGHYALIGRTQALTAPRRPRPVTHSGR